MKFALVFTVLLLVPMALADRPRAITSRSLYRNNHMISQGTVDFRHFKWSDTRLVITFLSKGRSSSRENVEEEINLYSKTWEKQGFAVETFALDKNEKLDREFCFQKSAVDKKLIGFCKGPISMRPMTNEESEQMQKWENEQKAAKSFKVVYKRGIITQKATGVREYNVDYWTSMNGVTTFNVATDDFNEDRRFIQIHRPTIDQEFVIENSSTNNTDCRKTDVAGLYIVKCRGNIQVRRLRGDD